MKSVLSVLIICMILPFQSESQSCTTLGQTPSTAFPVCGTTTFKQSTVPICSTNSLYVPGCTNSTSANYANKNPFWYQFTCFQSGTLGFTITPNDISDDYDWQLYDITGLDPNQVFTNQNIIVSGNWAGNPGNTGASNTGVPYIQCASPYDGTENRFARMPNIIQGHTYILLVSHFSDSQSGYSLDFKGGTAVITDPTDPKMSRATPSCDGQQLFVKLNKKMKCSSLAADGSDFKLSIPGINVVAATGVNCNNSFNLDSLVLTLSAPLPPGDYFLIIKNGTDGNTILDNCDRGIPESDQIPFKILTKQPTPMDSLVPVNCAPKDLTLVFEKPIRCSTVSPDGSDFLVTGPVPVTITSAIVECNANGTTSSIKVNLNQPLVKGGNYQITLKNGTDGGTITDECGMVTPAGQSVSFSLKDTVNADFTYQIGLGCRTDTIQFFHPGNNGVNQWTWNLADIGTSSEQNPVAYYHLFGPKDISLSVSNGFCSDSASATILLDNLLRAAFQMPGTICPEDSAVFQNQSIGKIVSYLWSFDNGVTSDNPNPDPQKYPMNGVESFYNIRLIVKDAQCADTTIKPLKVLNSCFIAVPNAFTPNNDGLNDYLYPVNAFKADGLEFRVYNRAGQLLFSSTNFTEKWDGTYKGEPQDAGIYVWTLKYTLRDTGKKFFLKGSTVLIR